MPFLVGDEDGAGDEGDEVHFEQTVHLVDILRHEQTDDDAEYILIKIGAGQRDLDRIIGDKRQTTDPESNNIGAVIMCEIDADEKEADEKVIHEPVGPTADICVEQGCLRLQVI